MKTTDRLISMYSYHGVGVNLPDFRETISLEQAF